MITIIKTVIGGGEKTLYNFDKIVDHSKLHGMAAARLTDYIKINAIFSDPDFIAGKFIPSPLMWALTPVLTKKNML